MPFGPVGAVEDTPLPFFRKGKNEKSAFGKGGIR
jgi:hypothetical protein